LGREPHEIGQVLGALGRNGRNAGEFHEAHDPAIDPGGNVLSPKPCRQARGKVVFRGDTGLRRRTPRPAP
jgi:hypothetical protein